MMNRDEYFDALKAAKEDQYLKHYGVKGMKWGVRKAKLYRRQAIRNATEAEKDAATRLHLSEYRNGSGKYNKIYNDSQKDKAYARKVNRANAASIGGLGTAIAGAGTLNFSKSKRAALIGAGLAGLGSATAVGGQIAANAADRIQKEYIDYEYLHRINPKKYPKINY